MTKTDVALLIAVGAFVGLLARRWIGHTPIRLTRTVH